MRAEHVICWALLLALPLTLPLAAWSWPTETIKASAWWGFGYVAVFSMWLGFFAWYRGLALGGTVRVSAVPLLGERLDAVTVGFGLAVIATVFIGKKMPVHQPTAMPASPLQPRNT
jgi:drug/metabolite transporter (DMT)-like permease